MFVNGMQMFPNCGALNTRDLAIFACMTTLVQVSLSPPLFPVSHRFLPIMFIQSAHAKSCKDVVQIRFREVKTSVVAEATGWKAETTPSQAEAMPSEAEAS